MKIIAPVRGWQMGREEEIEYAREHGIPVKGGTETPPYSIDDNLWAARPRAGRSRTWRSRRPTTSSSSSHAPRRRRTSPRTSVGFEAACRWRSTASGSGWWS